MSSSSSFGASQSKHDVFLNFRGEDTRCTFTSHLYAALCRNKIDTYIDDEAIKRGDKLSSTLLSAIESSKICITIFSQNYASSAWCLNELEKIIECKEKNQLIVVPVFYHIDPSHVRYQKGVFEDAFIKHEEHFRDNLIKVQKWRIALSEAANSAGWDSSNIRLESELVEKIVEDTLLKLKRMSPHLPKGLVGITRHIARVESLLSTGSTDVRIIGIWGMGGIGKTTTAEAVCAKLCSQYEGYCFIANVREEWENHRENDLRNKILNEILDGPNLYISTPNMSSTFVIERLKRKKVLIVLDDLSDSKQMEYLVGEKQWLGPGSRIMVTTRNKEVFNKEVDGVYEVTKLNDHEALKLFSMNAFQQEHPIKEFSDLSERVVEYAKGVPLALKVLGLALYSKRPNEWESMLKKLKKVPKTEIYNGLRLSYEGLDHEEQDIFLDIACFLKGESVSHITSLLNGCGFSADIGIRSLQDRSLIAISKDHKVQMHDLIQEMGWQIVREESIKEPGKRSRLWDPKEIYDVFKYNRGTDTIECIMLDMSQIKDVTISPQTFSRMYKLRLLKVYMPSFNKRSKVLISRGLECLPDELSYLQWDCFPLKSLPPLFCAEKLVELDLKHSPIEKLWDGTQDLVNLKSLNLSGCKKLIELPDFSLASKLEEIHLDDCISLLNVPSSILSLDSLFVLSLKGCKQIHYIESEKKPRSLRWLNLRGCLRLVKFSVASDKLEYLSLDGTTIEELPSLVGQLKNLSRLNLRHCGRLQNLPYTFYEIGLDCSIQFLDCPKLERLPPILDASLSITTLCLDCCSNLSELPDNLGLLQKLSKLSLRGTNIENLPGSIKDISLLRSLNVSNCRRLRSLPELPLLLQYLNASNCVSLETVSSLGVTLLQDSFSRLNKMSLLRRIQDEEKMSIRHCDYFGRFEFYNCIKLDQIARKTIMKEALIRIQLAAYLSSKIEEYYDPYCQTEEGYKKFGSEDFVYIPRAVYFTLPGSKVPNWFMHKTTDSSIITLKLSPRWHRYCNYLGFAFCVVLGSSRSNREKNHDTGFMAGCRYYFGGKYVGSCVIKSSSYDAKQDQLLLWYDKLLKVREETSIITLNEMASFEFFVRSGSSGVVVKSCGIRPLYAPNDIIHSSNEQDGSREGKRLYVEFEAYENQRQYWLFRGYAHPPDSLGLPYRDGYVGKSLPLVYSAKSIDELTMRHERFSNGAEVSVYFGLVSRHHHHTLRYLAQLILDGYCNFGKLLDNINVLSSLRRLELHGFNVESLPASIEHLSGLEHLSLIECKRLKSLPELPQSLWRLELHGCNVESLPASIKHLSRLEDLSLIECKWLKSLPELPPLLWILKLHGSVVESLPASIKRLSSLEGLSLIECKRLKSLPELPPSLFTLKLHGCIVESLPASIKHLSRLGHLSLVECEMLKSLPELPPSLWRLELHGCDVESLPASIKNLSRLEHLSLIQCKRLKSLPKLPSSLSSLYVHNCTCLEAVELTKESKMIFVVNQHRLVTHKEFGYEEALIIEVIDRGIRVISWEIHEQDSAVIIKSSVSSQNKPWSIMCASGTIKVTFTR